MPCSWRLVDDSHGSLYERRLSIGEAKWKVYYQIEEILFLIILIRVKQKLKGISMWRRVDEEKKVRCQNIEAHYSLSHPYVTTTSTIGANSFSRIFDLFNSF